MRIILLKRHSCACGAVTVLGLWRKNIRVVAVALAAQLM